ncbi:hypothetical protein M0812_27792 [Anaeramoeba flamelloides]|uniref:Uncharacterized protein n=1 Tax=Anaeramoeba flamelloides TaxID=1746091 RepID=A0AAV7Y771_9EUKA|nr:hypothetical protein M0812_27792 [Anaeramoeba flamelloides]
MEREYKEHIDTIKKKINKKFIKEIENTKPFYETEKKPLKPLNFFEKEEIEGQLKWIKNKSVKQFDKIFLYKKDTKKKRRSKIPAKLLKIHNNTAKNLPNSDQESK